jgi:hypothetical protein
MEPGSTNSGNKLKKDESHRHTDFPPFFFFPLLLPFAFLLLDGGTSVATRPLRTMLRASFSANGASLNTVPLQARIRTHT